MCNYNFIIKQKKIKSEKELVAPIFLNQDKWYPNQLAYQELKGKYSDVKDKTEKGLSISKEILTDHLPAFMKDIVKQNLNSCGIQSTPTTAIEIILKSIPIYVVCKNYNRNPGKTDAYDDFKNEFEIPDDKIAVYNITEIKQNLKDDDKDVELDPVSLDILGLYVYGSPISSNNNRHDLSHERRIFLWIDKIFDEAKKKNIVYEHLLAFVLCHEFMHALMDLFDKIVNPSSNWGKVYYHFREESLANGLAIYLMKQHLDIQKWQSSKLEDFVKSQPDAYKLGLKYQDGINLQKDVQEWINEKRNLSSLTIGQMKKWLSNVANNMSHQAIPIPTNTTSPTLPLPTNTNMIQQLKNNPIFQMSLSSKELFHSNFLAWLAEDPNTEGVFADLLEKCFGFKENKAKEIASELRKDDSKYMVLREYKNFDFCICERLMNPDSTADEKYIPGRVLLVLENKFKSIPYLAQLTEYEGKVKTQNDLGLKINAENEYRSNPKNGNWNLNKKVCKDTLSTFADKSQLKTKYVLLTLAKDVCGLKIENGLVNSKWHVVQYLDYANVLKPNNAITFTEQIISNYSSFIRIYIDYVNTNLYNKNILNENWSLISSQKDLKSIRMDDIWQKLVANIICINIFNELKKRNRRVEGNVNAASMFDTQTQKDDICVNAGFSRGTAIIEVKIKKNNDTLYGIQIQNGQYRYFIEKPKGSIVNDIDVANLVKKFTTRCNNVCKYDQHFKYKYDDLKGNSKIEDIINKVVSEITQLK